MPDTPPEQPSPFKPVSQPPATPATPRPAPVSEDDIPEMPTVVPDGLRPVAASPTKPVPPVSSPNPVAKPTQPNPVPATTPASVPAAVGEHDIPEMPVVVPEGLRPASATSWSSKLVPSHMENINPPSEKEGDVLQYSDQSKLAIDAIREGLKDADCSQIDAYGPGLFSAQFRGHHNLLEGIAFSSAKEYLQFLREIVEDADAVTTWEKIEEERWGVLNLQDGSRLTIIMPPFAKANAPTFSLRKHTAKSFTPVSFVENGTMSPEMLSFLLTAVAAKTNILFVGAMGSGKTSLLRSLAEGFGENERISVIEQIPELDLQQPLVSPYVYQPTVEGMTLASILDVSLYNGVDRLIVGEVHLEGITKLMETMIVCAGSMSTYHAFTTEQAGERMKMALQIENQNISALTAVAFIKQAIDIVVVLEKVNGKRRITQITEIDWRSTGGRETLAGSDLFVFNREKGVHEATGNRPDEQNSFMKKCDAQEPPIEIPDSWFVNHDEMAAAQAMADQVRRR